MALRTYAPKADTPILKYPKSKEHLSSINAITSNGKLIISNQCHNYRGPDIVKFLKKLMKNIKGKILLLWDGATIHRTQPVKDFLASIRKNKFIIQPFPGYAPDTNPSEGIWNYLKKVELKNVCCQNLEDLFYQFNLAVARLRNKPSIIKSCFKHAGYFV
jgi:transposase